MFCAVQIKCAPVGSDLTPSPTTLTIIDRFANEKEARAKWPGDQVYEPKSDVPGQHVYLVLWNMSQPLNLHREVDNNNTISNVGTWFDRSPAKPPPKPVVVSSSAPNPGARRAGAIPRRPGAHYRPPSAFHQV